jgi:hypothetical protein
MLQYVPLISAFTGIAGLVLSTIALFWIRTVHISINSRMDQLLKEKGLASLGEGLAKGIEQGIEQGVAQERREQNR